MMPDRSKQKQELFSGSAQQEQHHTLVRCMPTSQTQWNSGNREALQECTDGQKRSWLYPESTGDSAHMYQHGHMPGLARHCMLAWICVPAVVSSLGRGAWWDGTKGSFTFCLGQRGSEWGLAGKDHRRRTEFAAMQRRMHLLSGHNFKRKKKNKITKTTTKKTQLFLTLDQLSSAWGGHLGNEPEEDLCLSFSFYSTFERIQNKCILKRPLSFVIEPRAKQATPGWSSLFPNENPSQAAGVGMWRAQNRAVHLQHLSCLLHAGGMITLYILPCTKPTYAGDRNLEDSTLLFRTQECKLCSHALNDKKIMLSCSSKQNPT